MTEYPNWFIPYAKPNFEKHLLSYAGKPGLQFLQLGTFTGDASVWLLDNVLTGENSTLDDVDSWQGSDEGVHNEMDFADVHRTYREKTQHYTNVRSHKVYTETFLAERRTNTYDFIYIDADHTAAGVIKDAVHSWRLLKPGGILAFDDYYWTSDKGIRYEPREAINFFCWSHYDELEMIEANEQVWVRKL